MPDDKIISLLRELCDEMHSEGRTDIEEQIKYDIALLASGKLPSPVFLALRHGP